MIKSFIIGLVGLALGLTGGLLIKSQTTGPVSLVTPLGTVTVSGSRREVLGFLPYWLLDKAQDSYKGYVTTLAYFSLTIADDGTIQKLVNPREEEPGWTTLQKDRVRNLLDRAHQDGLKTSLVIFNGNEESIQALLSDPVTHATNLLNDISPIMKEYKFDDLNLDIESVVEASPSSQLQFTNFVRTLREGLNNQKLGTLTMDMTVPSLFQNEIANPTEIAQLVDTIILMTYDYSYAGSFRSGPVSPLGGAGVERFNDVAKSIARAVQVIPPGKLLLGIPFYGYEWETLSDNPGSAVVPSTGQTASDRRVEQVLASCTECIQGRDLGNQEPYVIFPDGAVYHQIYYTDTTSLNQKKALVQNQALEGVAFWALGYEGDTTLLPFKDFGR